MLGLLDEVAVSSYTPFPKQALFHASPARYRLFGGAAGPGKSKALVEEGHQTCMEVANSDSLLLRRTFKELEASLLNKFERDIPYKKLGIRYNRSEHVAHYPNGARLIFGYCRRENDVYQYQGGAYVFIGIDELTLFTLKMWQFLSTRNRADGKVYTEGPNKGLPAFASMAGASNPGNTGHQFVKALFVDKRPAPGMEHPERYDPRNYDFIRARIEDNPILMADTEYLEKLRDLPETLRKAFLEGDWNIFAGQYFDLFQRGEHTCEPEKLKRKPWYPCWISIDWGFGHPAAVYWHWQEQERTVTYRELVTHRPGELGKGLTPRALAMAIVERMPKDEHGKLLEKIHEIDLSADAIDDKHSWGENSVAELMDDVFLAAGLPPCTRADNERVGGWALMYQLLKNRLWMISEDCERLIETLPMMTRDEDNLEDCLKVEGDDPPDAARYGLKTKLAPRHKPVEVRVAERVEALAITGNPTAEMMMSRKIYAEERKKFKPRRIFGPRFGGFRH